MNLKTKITEIHYDKNAKGLIFKILKAFSFLYYPIIQLRNFFYDKNLIKVKKVKAYVISVGNLTTGGVGKTPVVAELAKYFQSKGEKVAIISRGYSAKLSNKKVNIISDGKKIYYNATEAGDEPFWFAQNLKGICVLTSKNRFNASKYAVEKLNVTKIILDDGFQHRKLYRDLNIVLLDSLKQVGNGNLLPAGPLREPLSSINRADKIIIVNKGSKYSDIQNAVKKYSYNKPVFICEIKPDYIYNIKTKEPLSKESPSVAICGIGQPQQFYNFLSNYNIICKKTFNDHHDYQLKDIEKINENIVTTEKDAVKLIKFNKHNIFALKLKTELDIEALIK